MKGRYSDTITDICAGGAGSIIGRIRRIWNGDGGGWLEGPHIYHIRDYYYLLAAEGGTGAGHMAVLARSRELFGDYEACPFNPGLTNRNDISKSVWCCGHADLREKSHEGNRTANENGE